MAEAENQTCGEQRLAEMGVVRWNLPNQSARSKRKPQTQEYKTNSPLNSLQLATQLLPKTLVFQEIHLLSVGLEHGNATEAPSFIDET